MKKDDKYIVAFLIAIMAYTAITWPFIVSVADEMGIEFRRNRTYRSSRSRRREFEFDY